MNLYRHLKPVKENNGSFRCPFADDDGTCYHGMSKNMHPTKKKAAVAHVRNVHKTKLPLSFDPVPIGNGKWACPIGGESCSASPPMTPYRSKAWTSPTEFGKVVTHVADCHPVCPVAVHVEHVGDLWSCPLATDPGMVCGSVGPNTDPRVIVQHIQECHARPMDLKGVAPRYVRSLGKYICPVAANDEGVCVASQGGGPWDSKEEAMAHVSVYHGTLVTYHAKMLRQEDAYLKKYARSPVVRPVEVSEGRFACPWCLSVNPEGVIEGSENEDPDDSPLWCITAVPSDEDTDLDCIKECLAVKLHLDKDGGDAEAFAKTVLEYSGELMLPKNAHYPLNNLMDGFKVVVTGVLNEQEMWDHIDTQHKVEEGMSDISFSSEEEDNEDCGFGFVVPSERSLSMELRDMSIKDPDDESWRVPSMCGLGR